MNIPDTATSVLRTATARAVALRNQMRAIKARHKEELAEPKDKFEKQCGSILAFLRHIGVQNMGTDAGTVYQRKVKKASLNDRLAFKTYVIENQAWDLLDWKANVGAAEAFAKKHGELPPGVTLSIEQALGVRSPGQKEGDDDDDA